MAGKGEHKAKAAPAPGSDAAQTQAGSKKVEQFKEKWGGKVQTIAVKVMNKTVRPAGGLWWVGPLLPVLVWALIPYLRAKTIKNEVYQAPKKVRRLYHYSWAALAWLGLGWSSLCLVLLSEPLAARWAPSAWFGIRANLEFKHIVEIVWCGLALLVFSLVLFLFRASREALHDGEHGAAAWATWQDVICDDKRRWSLPLQVHYRGVRRKWNRDDTGTGVAVLGPPDSAVCAHVLLVGSTGSGKGASIFGHIITSSTVPVIYQDVKAEVPFGDAPKMRGALRWGCAADKGWPSMRWNPLEEARREKDAAERDSAFETLASMLMPCPPGKDESWVQEVGRPILAEGLKTGKFETLGDFADSVRDLPLQEILAHLDVPRGLQGLLSGTNVPEYIGSAFYSNLACYRAGWGRVVTSGHDFTMEEFTRKGGYVLSAESEANRALPLQLFWRMLLRKLMRATGKVPLTILMDEGLAAGKIPNLRQALETLRNRGVSLWMGIQSESGLLDVYSPTTGKAILDTYGNRITLLHGLDSQDAENLSKRLGTWTMRRKSPNQQAQVSPVPLLTISEMGTRGKRVHDRWAVFEMRESALSGLPLIARTLEAPFPTRRPSKDELEAFYRQYPDLRPEVVALLGQSGSSLQPAEPVAPTGAPSMVDVVSEALGGMTAPATAPASIPAGGMVAAMSGISTADVLAEALGGAKNTNEPLTAARLWPSLEGEEKGEEAGEVEGVQARVATEGALGGVEAEGEAPAGEVVEEVVEVVEAVPVVPASEVKQQSFSLPWG